MRKRRQVMIDLVLALVALIGGQTFFGTPVFGATNSTISISLGASPTLDLIPGEFGSTTQSISVTTDNYTGYAVSLTNSVSATDLVNTTNNTLVIPTITLQQGSSSIPASSFTNGYGISYWDCYSV